MANLRDLASICQGKTVYIQTHNFPDPDAIGSAFGLQDLLHQLGVEAEICYDGTIDKLSTSKMLELFHIKMYFSAEICDRLREEDYIICVDSQKNAGNMTDFTGNEIAAIDHHPTYVEVPYLYSDIRKVGACCTIVAGYYRALNLTPKKSVATALLYGIKMDTLQFTRGVTLEDIDAFGFLLPHINTRAMSSLETNNLEFQDLKAYGAAIENVRVYGYTGLSRIPFACPDALIAILSDFILSLIEVEVAVVYCERKNGLKFSVRSERANIDAGSLTYEALKGLGDGGGHASMAGGLIPKKNIPLLGAYPDDALRDRFMEFINRVEAASAQSEVAENGQ